MRLLAKASTVLPPSFRVVAAGVAAYGAKKTSGTKTRVFIAAVITAGVGAAVSFKTPALGWLPEASDSAALLGPLLGAQAAIAALTLAVTLFVMQGVSNRRDADDRMYGEYVSRSWVRRIFWSSIAAVGLTGGVLLAERFVGGALATDTVPGLRNLTLMAVGAFFGNLASALVLFEKALALSRPEQWLELRRDVNRRDVRGTVQNFLRQLQQVSPGLKNGATDLAYAFPAAGEDLADEAIRALLDDGRRAMAEQRHGEFERTLTSLEELVEHAMDEIERRGIGWGAPGSQAQWPPLSGLGRNLYTFREEVIRRDGRDYSIALLKLDYWLLSTGVRRRCGELFTAALEGYRWNYRIATRLGNGGLREIFRDRVCEVAWGPLLGVSAREAHPYIIEMERHQERLLSDSMRAKLPGDFERLQTGFDGFLRTIGSHWGVESWRKTESTELYERIEQDYRIALMGLGGRAVVLAEAGGIDDPSPYLQAAIGKYSGPGQLAQDLAQALFAEERSEVSLWSQWEMEDAEHLEARMIQPERYPLTLFCVGLLELTTDSMPPLDLRGRAKQVLDWFTENSDRLGRHVLPSSEVDVDKRNELAVAALEDAVRRDEVSKDLDVASWQLSTDKVTEFKAGVHASAVGTSSIEHLFKRAEAFLHLDSDALDGPKAREVGGLVPKEFLAEVPKQARTHYEPLRGGPLGQGLTRDIVKSFRDAFDGPRTVTSRLNSSDELLRAIDDAREGLRPQSELLVLLIGDWSNIIGELSVDSPGGYEPIWQEAGWPAVVARYLGHTVLFAGENDVRQLYIVEPKSWGLFVRAQAEKDNDLTVEVTEVSADIAKKLLDANANHFPDEPDRAAKLRKLQAHVLIRAVARVGFRVADPTRARHVVDADE